MKILEFFEKLPWRNNSLILGVLATDRVGPEKPHAEQTDRLYGWETLNWAEANEIIK